MQCAAHPCSCPLQASKRSKVDEDEAENAQYDVVDGTGINDSDDDEDEDGVAARKQSKPAVAAPPPDEAARARMAANRAEALAKKAARDQERADAALAAEAEAALAAEAEAAADLEDELVDFFESGAATKEQTMAEAATEEQPMAEAATEEQPMGEVATEAQSLPLGQEEAAEDTSRSASAEAETEMQQGGAAPEVETPP